MSHVFLSFAFKTNASTCQIKIFSSEGGENTTMCIYRRRQNQHKIKFLEVTLLKEQYILYSTQIQEHGEWSYHCATIVKVVLILMSMGTEIHASSDSREWTAFLQAKPAFWSFRLRLALRKRTEIILFLYRHPRQVHTEQLIFLPFSKAALCRCKMLYCKNNLLG